MIIESFFVPRFALRVLRSLPNTRRKLNSNVLKGIINGLYGSTLSERDALLEFVEDEPAAMEVDAPPSKPKSGKNSFT